MQRLERSISNKVRCDVESDAAIVETKVHDATSSAMATLVFLRMELAMRSADASSTPNPSNVVLDRDQRYF